MEVTKNKDEAGKSKEAKKPGIDPGLLDQLIEQYERPEEAAGTGGLLGQLTKRVYERILSWEKNHYLGYAKVEARKLAEGQVCQNHRDGGSRKTQDSDVVNVE